MIHNANGHLAISSITERRYLTVKGDGISTLKILISENDTSRFRKEKIFNKCRDELEMVIEKDKECQPIAIGNWDYGATYIEKIEIVNKGIIEKFENINNAISLFNYARYDIKCKTFDDFIAGKMKILEINGVKGEPIHIYDRKFTLLEAYKEIFRHWEFIMKISKRNLSNGINCPNALEGFKMLFRHYRIKKNALKNKIVK